MPCVVARTGVPTARIEEIFTTLGPVLTVRKSVAACEACSGTTDVFALI